MQIFQRTFAPVPHHKWTSREPDASCPTPTSPGGRTGGQGQVGSTLSAEGSFPGRWFFAYLLGEDGICSSLHFATARPVPHTTAV